MNQALDVVMLKEIGLSTVSVEGEPLHLLHVRNLKGASATFALSQDHLSALIVRAQECLTKGIEHQFDGPE